MNGLLCYNAVLFFLMIVVLATQIMQKCYILCGHFYISPIILGFKDYLIIKILLQIKIFLS